MLRTRLARTVPAGQVLPGRQPAYVQSWIYVFGVLTLAAFAVVLATGTLLAVKGTAWWHTSAVGHLANSLHLWSVELFFLFMVVHLWGKFFMAAWRGRRGLTWATGAVRSSRRSGPHSPVTWCRPTSIPSSSPPRPRTG